MTHPSSALHCGLWAVHCVQSLVYCFLFTVPCFPTWGLIDRETDRTYRTADPADLLYTSKWWSWSGLATFRLQLQFSSTPVIDKGLPDILTEDIAQLRQSLPELEEWLR